MHLNLKQTDWREAGNKMKEARARAKRKYDKTMIINLVLQELFGREEDCGDSVVLSRLSACPSGQELMLGGPGLLPEYPGRKAGNQADRCLCQWPRNWWGSVEGGESVGCAI